MHKTDGGKPVVGLWWVELMGDGGKLCGCFCFRRLFELGIVGLYSSGGCDMWGVDAGKILCNGLLGSVEIYLL